MASGDRYTPWDDRDSAPTGERGQGSIGSQGDYFGSWGRDPDSLSSRDPDALSNGDPGLSNRDPGQLSSGSGLPSRHDPAWFGGRDGGDPANDLDRRLPAQWTPQLSGGSGDGRYIDALPPLPSSAPQPEPRHDPRSEIYGDRPFSGFVTREERETPGDRPASPPVDGFKRGGFREWPAWARVLTALGVLIVALVVTHLFFFQVYSVQSSTMAPTLQAGDRLLVNKVVYNFRAPKRGEVILFHGSSKWTPEGSTDADSGIFASVGSTIGGWVGISAPSSDEYFRRVIAVPGDTIACCDVNGHVTVNGAPLNETYVVNDSPTDVSSNAPACGSRSFDPVVVGAGAVFVMGDNRVESLDSRCLDQVPINQIVGRVTAKVWGSWSAVSVPSTFKSVPKSYSFGPPRPAPVSTGAGLVLAMPLLLGFGVAAGRDRSGRRVGRRRRTPDGRLG